VGVDSAAVAGRRLTQALLLLALWAGRVGAQTAAGGQVSARLEWQRTAGAQDCASADELMAGAEGLLGRSVFGADAGTAVVVRGQVFREADANWVAHIAFLGPEGRMIGERDLAIVAADCHALDQSLMVVLALMVDVDEQKVSLRLPVAPPPSQSDGRRRMEIAVGGIMAHGLLPGIAAGAEAAVAYRLAARWTLEGRGLFWAPAGESSGGRGAEAWAWQGGVAGCREIAAWARASLDVCVGGEAGRFAARGTGLDVSRQASGVLLDAFGSARLSVPLPGWWQVRIGVDAVAAAVQNRFLSFNPQGQDTLFQSAPVAQRLEIDIGTRAVR
jgi:hypothetical protein